MNIFRRFQLSRDRSVTVANLIDELLRRYGNCEVSVERDSPRFLAELKIETQNAIRFAIRRILTGY